MLAAAERVLRSEGFNALSVRRITTEAEANIASVTYAFGGKEGLLQALVVRILTPVTVERVRRLNAVARREHEVADLVAAFADPLLDCLQQLGPHYEAVATWVGESIEHSSLTVHTMEPGLQRFVEVLSPHLPHLPIDILYFRIRTAVGAIHHYATGLTRTMQTIPDVTADHQLRLFIAGGLAAPLDE
ncbi:TetR/AcrR family transcriptional regulator [Williamsia maris]|uniref:TetR/AcrR family transcriptional regulator n=1 Tax=Williamsia maris TaxID=72806 RepID=UPI0020A5B244|nr:TetR family transcriptional regulator [Williamsia maris]